MVRVVRGADGSLTVGRNAPGRGAWLCRGSPGCVDLAVRRRAFERALRGPVDGSGLAEVRSAVGPAPGARQDVG